METEIKFFGKPKYTAFIENEDFGGSLFEDTNEDTKLLTIAIVPSSFPEELVDFQSKEKKEWLKTNLYRNHFYRPFLDGVRFMDFYDEKEEKLCYVVSLFTNAVISHCGELHCSPTEKEIPLPSIFSGDIKELIPFVSKFYGEIGFNEPVKIYFQIKNIEGLLVNKKREFTDSHDYSEKIEGTWHKKNLEFIEESSGEEIQKENAKVSKRISERLAHAFGIRTENN